MLFSRVLTKKTSSVTWTTRDARIINDHGKVIFELCNVEAPDFWSDTAVNIVSSKYFKIINGQQETSVKQLIHRVVHTITSAGIKYGYFTKEVADVFYDELSFIIINQFAIFNSPVFFNLGVPGRSQQVSACFLLDVDDNMESIMRWISNEAIIFKGGSGSGCNISKLRARGTPLSAGGTSSGPMSFLKVADVSAGAIKSGGACLAGNQFVYTESGPIQVQNLVGKEFIVLSYDPSAQRYKAKKATAWSSGEKEVFKLKTNEGVFYLSLDHPLKLASGEARRVIDLKPGDSLFQATIDNYHGFPRVELHNKCGETEIWHRLIVKDVYGWDIENYSIHHKDGNRYNNSIRNLERLHQADNVLNQYLDLVKGDECMAHPQQLTCTDETQINNPKVVSITSLGKQPVFDVEVNCPTLDDKSSSSGHNFVLWSNDQHTGSGIAVFNTRRAACLRSMDVSHPDILEFINCKIVEEEKARTLINAGYSGGIDGDAYATVSYQNFNSSVRITDSSMKNAISNPMSRDGLVLDAIANAAHKVADPGVQFQDTIDAWYTLPNSPGGKNRTSNPCQPSTATVLTPNGMRMFKQISVGSVIWSGKQWTRVLNKVSNGIKPVYKYLTAAGHFLGTNTHQIISNKIRVVVAKASTIDIAVGPIQHTVHSTDLINKNKFPRVHFETVPEEVLFGDTKTVLSFLGSLYSEKSSISNSRITLRISSFDFILQVQQLLSTVGIRSYYTKYRDRESYDLNITSDRDLFINLVGLRQKDKNDVLTQTINQTHSTSLSKDTFDIFEVQSLGEQEVFDLTVDCEEHTYWTGGLLASNCGEYLGAPNSACNLAAINLVKTADNIEIYKYIIDILIVAMDILVALGEFPTEEITENTRAQRELGLGFTNLGAYLMSKGLPYDSDAGRHLSARLMSTLTAEGYKQSAHLARDLGTFKEFNINHDAILNVIDKHFHAAKNLGDQDVVELWQEVRKLGEKYGFRNSTISCEMPTGTTSLIMDCSTTSCEPDISLVKYKTLVGGGCLKLVNRSVEAALQALNYEEGEIQYILSKLESGVIIENLLHNSDDAHVFQTAFGVNALSPLAHVMMVAALQPHMSMAASKTVNLPTSASVEDIKNVYIEAWKLGVKCISVYRDGSKIAQPLNVSSVSKPSIEKVIPTNNSNGYHAVVRRPLPKERQSITHKIDIGGFEGYVTAGFYPTDGTVGECFINASKEGATLSGLLDALSIVVSISLQYGVPLKELANKLIGTKFEPAGFTQNSQIPNATSILDYVFRWLLIKSEQKPLSIARTFTAAQYLIDGVESSQPTQQQSTLSGDICKICGSLMIQTGVCHTCPQCGFVNGGC